MSGLRRALGLVALEGLIVGLVAVVVIASSDHADAKWLRAALSLAIGWSFIGTGLYAWWRRPDNRFGLLMTFVGFTFFLSALAAADADWLFTLGMLLGYVYLAVFMQMLLGYPEGRIVSARLRALVVGGYLLALAGPLPALLFGGPDWLECDCPESVIAITDSETIFRVADWLVTMLGVGLVVAVVSVLVRRWREATPHRRRAMAPVLWSGICLLVLLAGQLASLAIGGPRVLVYGAGLLGLAFLALTPYGFLFSILRSRVLRAGAVSDLLMRMGDTRGGGGLRELLADALGDRSLQVVYWLEQERRWVDAEGRPASVPEPGDPIRGFTPVDCDGRRVGAIVHDRMLADDDDLMRSVAGGAAVLLENERLQAELRAKVEALRASRARLVNAGTAERRRLERNLHDGAQQRLVALSLALRLAQSRLRREPDAAASLLAGAQEELGLALEELRELARGIHPAVLSDRGLRPALEALAGRSPIPVELTGTPLDRLPAPVEAAAYFVVAEALTNVAKYARASQARVCVTRANGHAVVEVADDGVGGADPGRGSGLRGLVDRVAALDGRMDLSSPRGAGTVLRAEIPV